MGREQCKVYGWSGEDAQGFINTMGDDPRMINVEIDRVELPRGDAAVYDILMNDGRQ